MARSAICAVRQRVRTFHRLAAKHQTVREREKCALVFNEMPRSTFSLSLLTVRLPTHPSSSKRSCSCLLWAGHFGSLADSRHVLPKKCRFVGTRFFHMVAVFAAGSPAIEIGRKSWNSPRRVKEPFCGTLCWLD